MRVISLGWGVQSWALCAMSALGVLPKVDVAIHADTTHERSETYDFARRWTPWLEERGVRVVTVSVPSQAAKVVTKDSDTPAFTLVDDWGGLSLPAHIFYPDGKQSGMLRRQCTGRWKIQPIKRWLQANRDKQSVEQWIGITLDEVGRMKSSDVKYVTLTYPFIEMLDRPWTRGMVMRWLQDNGLEIPVKSSCIFCPYHDRATWREIKMSGNGDWQKSLEVDAAIRDKRPGYKCYLTAQRVPLTEVDFRSEEDYGQLSLWGGEECSGMCFL